MAEPTLPELNPLHFVGRLLYLTRWLLDPQQANDVVDMELRLSTESEEAAFECTGTPVEAVQLGRASFLAESLFYDAMDAYTDLASELPAVSRIVVGSNVVWEWICWLAWQAYVQSSAGVLRHAKLDVAQSQQFEQRLDEYLQKTYGWWWYRVYKVVPKRLKQSRASRGENSGDDLLPIEDVSKGLEALFSSLAQWNTTPYDAYQLLRAFHMVVHDYHVVYATTPRFLAEERKGEVEDFHFEFSELARYEVSDLASKVALRLVYLSAFFQAFLYGWSTESVLDNSEDFEARLLWACEVPQLLASFAKGMTDVQPSFYRQLAAFWDWYTEEVLLRLDMFFNTPTDEGKDLIHQQVSGFLREHPYCVSRETDPRTRLSDNDMRLGAIRRVIDWMGEFADSPFQPFALLQQLIELEERVWKVLESSLRYAIEIRVPE